MNNRKLRIELRAIATVKGSVTEGIEGNMHAVVSMDGDLVNLAVLVMACMKEEPRFDTVIRSAIKAVDMQHIGLETRTTEDNGL